MPKTHTQVDALVDRYGSKLDDMELEDKLALRAVLAHYVYVREVLNDEEHNLNESFAQSIEPVDATTYDFQEVILPTLDGIEIQEAETLIAALTAQFHS